MTLRTREAWVAFLSLLGALEDVELLMPGSRAGQGGY